MDKTETKPRPRPKHERSTWHYGLAMQEECPHCSAPAGEICRTPRGAKKSSLHEDRWALIADAPTSEELVGPAPEKPPAGTSMYDDAWGRWNVAFDRWSARLRAAQERWESEKREAKEAFQAVLLNMGLDNCTRFNATDSQRRGGGRAVSELLAAGFFRDDPDDLDGSYWQAAAGEVSEAREFFAAAPAAYERLSKVLNEIFEGS